MTSGEQSAGPLHGAELYQAVIEAQNRMGEGIVIVDRAAGRSLFANQAYSGSEVSAGIGGT